MNTGLEIKIQKGYVTKRKYNPLAGNAVTVTQNLYIFDNPTQSYVLQEITNPDLTLYDITQDVVDLDGLDFEYSFDEIGLARYNPGSTNNITIVGDAYQLIYDWMLASPELQINYFNVFIKDTENDIEYETFVIKADNVSYDYLKGCEITLPLRQSDEKSEILNSTFINDNWQGWFADRTFDNNGNQITIPQEKKARLLHVFSVPSNVKSATLGFDLIGLGLISFIDSIPLLGSIISFDNKFQAIGTSIGAGTYLPALTIEEILTNALSKYNKTFVFDMVTTLDRVRIEYSFRDTFVIQPLGGVYYRADDPTQIVDIIKANDTSIIVKDMKGNIQTPLSSTEPLYNFAAGNFSTMTLEEFVIELCKIYSLQYEFDGNVLTFTANYERSDNIDFINNNQEDILSFTKEFSEIRVKGGALIEYEKDKYDTKSGEVAIIYDGGTGELDLDTSKGKESIAVDKKIIATDYDKIQSKFAPIGVWGDGFGEDVLESMLSSAEFLAFSFAAILAITGVSLGLEATGVPFVALGQVIAGGLILAGAIGLILFTNDAKIQVRNAFGYTFERNTLQINGDGRKSNLSLVNYPSKEYLRSGYFYTSDADKLFDDDGNFDSALAIPKYGNTYDATSKARIIFNPHFLFSRLLTGGYDCLLKKRLNMKYGMYQEQTGVDSKRVFSENIQLTLPFCKSFFFASDKINKFLRFKFQDKFYIINIKNIQISYSESIIKIKGLLSKIL